MMKHFENVTFRYARLMQNRTLRSISKSLNDNVSFSGHSAALLSRFETGSMAVSEAVKEQLFEELHINKDLYYKDIPDFFEQADFIIHSILIRDQRYKDNLNHFLNRFNQEITQYSVYVWVIEYWELGLDNNYNERYDLLKETLKYATLQDKYLAMRTFSEVHYFFRNQEKEQLKVKIDEYMQICQKANLSDLFFGLGYNTLFSYYYTYTFSPVQAEDAYKKAKAIYEKHQCEPRLTILNIRYATFKSLNNEIPKAISILLELQNLPNLNTNMRSTIYHNLAEMYLCNEQTALASIYYKKAYCVEPDISTGFSYAWCIYKLNQPKSKVLSVIRQVKKSKDIRDGFWYLCEWLRCIIVHEKDSHLHLLEKASTYFKDNQEIYFIHELMMYECLRMNNYDACLSHALSLLNDQTVFKSIPPKS